jgi:AcrR family transcriptional regulator
MKRTTKRASAGRKPPRKTSQSRGEITRDRLIAVACDQFVRNGFHGTSMRQLTTAAGVAVGGIYNHFYNKDDIFAAVLDTYHPYRVILPALEEVPGTTLEAFFGYLAERVAGALRGNDTRLVPLLLIELVEFQGEHLQALAETVFPKVLALVQGVDERGGHEAAWPTPVVLRTFVSLMVGHTLTQLILSKSALFQQTDYDWLGANVDIFLHGILADRHV